MRTLAAAALAVALTGCASTGRATSYHPTALRQAPSDAGGALAYWRACSEMGLAVVAGMCGRWVNYDFVLHEVPAEAVDRFRREP